MALVSGIAVVVVGVALSAVGFGSNLRSALDIFDEGPWPTVSPPEGMNAPAPTADKIVNSLVAEDEHD